MHLLTLSEKHLTPDKVPFLEQIVYFLQFNARELAEEFELLQNGDLFRDFTFLGASENGREIFTVECAEQADTFGTTCGHALHVTHESELSETGADF